MNIGNRLQILRIDLLSNKKLTRKQFGEKIGVSEDVIKNIEYNRVEIKDHIIKLICQTFNVNEDWLRNGNEPIFIEKETKIIDILKENGVKPMVLEIIQNYLNMSDEKKEKFDSYLKELIGSNSYNKTSEFVHHKIKEFPKQEQKEMVKIIARGEGITEIPKEELEELKRNSVRLDPEDYDKYF